MSHQELNESSFYNDEGVEVDFYDGDDGSITIIHDTDLNQTREDIMAASSSHISHQEALHNLNLSVIRKPSKEVRFSNIKVRTYPICVGDNPACSDGVPLAIDWQYLKEYNFTVDYYERKLEKWANSPDSPMHPNRYPRKTEEDLRISAKDRMQLLFSAGIMPPELTIVFRSIEAVRRKREASIRSLHFLQMMYAWERIQRATRNATVRRASKRKERLLLKPYRDQSSALLLLEDSVEINVDAVSTTTPNNNRRWFCFRNNNNNKSDQTAGRLLHHHHNNNKRNNKKNKHPRPIVLLNQSYETASVATNTPQSVVSYNGDTLFPPTPNSSPLTKTIRERKIMTALEPRIIDMTGQVSPVSSSRYGNPTGATTEPRIIDMTGQVSPVSSSKYGNPGTGTTTFNDSPRRTSPNDNNNYPTIARSPTMKRTNKPRDRLFDDDDFSSTGGGDFLIGEGIMERSTNISMDYYNNNNDSVDRYAPANNFIQQQEDANSVYSTSSSSVFNKFRHQLDYNSWIGGGGTTTASISVASTSGHQHHHQQPMSSSNASNHSQHYHHSRRNDVPNSSMSVTSFGSGSHFSNNIREFAGSFTTTMGGKSSRNNKDDHADRGYFLDADERYY